MRETTTVNKLMLPEEQPVQDLQRLKSIKIDARIFINQKKGKATENYHIESMLGEGTYGKVLLVTHKKTGLRRALKSKEN